MIINIYAIYDKKAESTDKPFVCPNDAVAIRSVKELVKNQTHFQQNANDYYLMKCGEYNMDKGEIDPMQKIVIEFTELVEKTDEQK
ncbi:MAG: nonstructural protein [Microvirus sp.]|nr:MAG: nonstructural protein [Microvirus sp.]